MKKDRLFWSLIVLGLSVHFVFQMTKPALHKTPSFVMDTVSRLEMYFQIVAGMLALWYSIDNKFFFLFLKIYSVLFLGYLLLKIPVLSFLMKYYVVVPNMFTPFPFVVCWLLDKAYSTMEGNQS